MLGGGNGGSEETMRELRGSLGSSGLSGWGGGWSGDGGDAEQGVKYLGSWEKQGLWERSFNNGLQTCGLSNEVGGDIIY